MVNVLLVVPYQGLQKTFEDCVASLDTRDLNIDIQHLYGSRFFGKDIEKYQIVAARGITGRTIRTQHPQVSFVEITVSSDDIINALDECVRLYGRKRIALVLAESTMCSASSIRRLSGLDLQMFYVYSEEDVDGVIREVIKQGFECVVGGLTVCGRCRELGIPCVFIHTGKEAAERTIRTAVETAKGINREQLQSQLLRTLLDHHHDAVLACDGQGSIVAANAQAGRLLGDGESQSLIGRPIDHVLPDSQWRKVAADGVSLDTMRQFPTGMTVLQCSPLPLAGGEAGVLFNIQNAEMIRDTDSKIQKQVRQSGFTARYTFEDIIAGTPEMKQRLAYAYKYARTDAAVLILGETGTGKEMFAQSIHNASDRANYPFVPVNCAALPEQLLESELFGYSEGSFSGAQKGGKVGLFELAHKGTIFLDEIGEMPLDLQAKLLRVLQEKNIRRIGDNKIIPVDVRVISATNVSIHDKIMKGTFRRDLYYRINLLELRLPPLRDRPGDVELIFRRMMERFSWEAGRPVPTITPEAAELMRRYSWKGNVRELRNFCERLTILNEEPVITPAQLKMAGLFELEAEARMEAELLPPPAAPVRKRKEDLAREMGISRTTLWRRSKRQEREKQNETK